MFQKIKIKMHYWKKQNSDYDRFGSHLRVKAPFKMNFVQTIISFNVIFYDIDSG